MSIMSKKTGIKTYFPMLRCIENSQGTISVLLAKGSSFFILEDPVRYSKIKGKTAVAWGSWRIFKKTASRFMAPYKQRFNHPYCLGVKPEFPQPKNLEFKHVMLHTGNTVEDTEGCFLIGKTANIQNMTVGASRKAYKEFWDIVDHYFEIGTTPIIRVMPHTNMFATNNPKYFGADFKDVK